MPTSEMGPLSLQPCDVLGFLNIKHRSRVFYAIVCIVWHADARSGAFDRVGHLCVQHPLGAGRRLM